MGVFEFFEKVLGKCGNDFCADQAYGLRRLLIEAKSDFRQSGGFELLQPVDDVIDVTDMSGKSKIVDQLV